MHSMVWKGDDDGGAVTEEEEDDDDVSKSFQFVFIDRNCLQQNNLLHFTLLYGYRLNILYDRLLSILLYK